MYHKLKTCRTCFHMTRGDFNFVTLDSVNSFEESNSPSLKEQLLTLVPEMKLDGSEDVICTSCFNALRTGYEFKKMCQLTESNIENHDYKYRTPSGVDIDITEHYLYDVSTPTTTKSILISSLTDLPEVTLGTIEPDENIAKIVQAACETVDYLKENQIKPDDLICFVKILTLSKASVKESISYYSDELNDALPCITCNQTFRTRYKLIVHQIEDHDAQKMFACTQCEKVFVNSSNLEKHVSECHVKAIESSLAAPVENAIVVDLEKEEPGLIIEPETNSEADTNIEESELLSRTRVEAPPAVTKCNICGRFIYSYECMDIHMYIHIPYIMPNEFEEKPPDYYRCYLCPKKFPEERFLELHNKRVHLSKKFECSKCKRDFKRYFWYENHKCKIAVKVPRDLASDPANDQVNESIRDAARGDAPIINFPTSPPFYCALCDRTFSRLRFLKSHTTRIHNFKRPNKYNLDNESKLYKVDDNEDLFNSSNSVEVVTSEEEYEPDDDEFDAAISSAEEYQGVRPDSPASLLPLLCDSCGVMIDANHDDNHICEHNKVRLQKSKKSDAMLEIAEPPPDPENGEATLKCQFCPKLFQWQYQLTNHIKKHLSGELTPEMGQQAEALKIIPLEPVDQENMDVTTIQRVGKRKLPVTDTLEDTREILKRAKIENEIDVIPIRNVTSPNKLSDQKNEKLFKFKCNHCSKSFNKTAKLLVHINVHTGERPYKCYICKPAKGFTQKGSLYVHYERKHAAIVENCAWELYYEKTGNCLTCGEIFERLHLMYQHAIDNYCKYTCEICNRDQTMACHYAEHNLEPRVVKVEQPDEPSSVEVVNVPLPRPKPRQPAIIKCDDCDKTFTKKRELVFHKKSLAHLQQMQRHKDADANDTLMEGLANSVVVKREKEKNANDQLQEKEEVTSEQPKEEEKEEEEITNKETSPEIGLTKPTDTTATDN